MRFTVRSPPVIDSGRPRSLTTLLNSDVTSSVGSVPNRLGRSDDTGAMLPRAAKRSWAKSTSKVGAAPPVTSGMSRSRLSVLGKSPSRVLSGMLMS